MGIFLGLVGILLGNFYTNAMLVRELLMLCAIFAGGYLWQVESSEGRTAGGAFQLVAMEGPLPTISHCPFAGVVSGNRFLALVASRSYTANDVRSPPIGQGWVDTRGTARPRFRQRRQARN